MKQLNPYLHFNGNCREAMTFYHLVLGGEIFLQTVGDSQMAGQMPPEMNEHIMHSTITVDGKMVLMASDMMDGEKVMGNTLTLTLVCSSKEEIETLFAKLSEGGTVGHPLKEEFFGTFGDLTDKYGFNWMFQFDQNAQ